MARFRRILPAVFALLAWVGAGGCVMSFHPLYEDSGLLLDNAVLGTWAAPACMTAYFPQWDVPEENGECTLEIREDFSEWINGGPTRKIRNGYRISITTEDGRTVTLSGHLVRLGGHLFLDTEGAEEPGEGKTPFFSAIHRVPTHNFWKIVPGPDTLSAFPMDTDRFAEPQDGTAADSPYEKFRGFVIFTAATPLLQEYVRKKADDPETFLNPTVWRRKPRVDASEPGLPETADPRPPVRRRQENPP